MAIVENKASEIGDVIVIRAGVPIIGLVTLSSFTDTLIGETGARFFDKEFRYSVDGINYSPWTPLTNPNISAVSVTPTITFLVEYRYKRVGTDTLGVLEFEEVEINGAYADVNCGQAFSNSVFAQLGVRCTDLCVLSWMINVLEKIYKEGILPRYFERGDEGNQNNQDQDFVEFWKSITQYFAYIVCYARKFELSNLTSNYEILKQYLETQTFMFCGNETIGDLTYIMNNTYDEMRHRGTYEIVKDKVLDSRDVDGELLRLLCYNSTKCGDFYFSKVFNYKMGWVVDQASPLYRGNYRDWNLTKAYEKTEDVVDLNKYPLVSPGNISIATDGSIDVMKINSVLAGQKSGIDYDSDLSKLIKVDAKWDYEITFQVKQEDLDDLLTFGIQGYDLNGNLVANPFKQVFHEFDYNYFFTKHQLGRNDKYYLVRGIIYGTEYRKPFHASMADYRVEVTKDFNFLVVPPPPGLPDFSKLPPQHLQFNEKDTCYISPIVLLDNENEGDASGAINIYDFKVRPLSTCYSTGFHQGSNLIKTKGTNSNQKYDNSKVVDLTREFLIPYNTALDFRFTNPCEDTNVDDVTDIKLDADILLTSPLTSNVNVGDRYLFLNQTTKIVTLKEYTAPSTWTDTDNAQGNVTYVTMNKNTYIYESGTWIFNRK